MARLTFRFFLGFAVFFVIAFPCATFAQSRISSSGGLIVSPTYQEVVVKEADDYVKASVSFTNLSNQVMTLQLIPVEFNEIDPYGKIFIPSVDTQDNVYRADYIRLSANEVTLAPRATSVVDAFVVNYSSLGPGGHYVAIVARAVDKSASAKQSILPAVSSLLLIRKEGGMKVGLSLVDMDWPKTGIVFSIPDSITLSFRNDGNVHIIPHGLVTFTDVFGRIVYRGVVNQSSSYVLPQKTRFIDVKIERLRLWFPIMFYSVSVQGDANLGDVSFSKSDSFIYVSPLFSIGTLSVVFALLFFRKRIYHLVSKVIGKGKRKDEKD